jgi:sugar lactone lactonase YvrE
MARPTPRPLLDNLVFPEGPRWRDGKLWFSDQHAHTVYRTDLRGRAEVLATVPKIPSGLGFLPDGSLLIVSEKDLRVLRWRAGQDLETYAELGGLAQGLLNDMVVDGRGRAYVGWDPLEVRPDVLTGILLVPPDGAPRVVARGLRYPNGMVITQDGKTLIAGETLGEALTAFDIEPDGSLTNQRIWAPLPAKTAADGICLDAEGAVWVASVFAGEFLRVAEGGKILDAIAVPGRWAVACTLGGPERRTLFLLLAETTLPELMQGQSKGSIEMVEIEVPGAGWP